MDFWYKISNEKNMDECKRLKTNAERFTYALKLVRPYHRDFLNFFKSRQKTSERSVELRENGNSSFRSGQYENAVQEYTASLMYAIDSSAEQALAYANRSAALFKLNKFSSCVTDIDRALEKNYPDELKTKLYKRKGLCLKELGSPNANSAFEEALVWLDRMNLNEYEMKRNESELSKLISAPYMAAKPPGNMKQYPVPKILTPNFEIPCASDAVRIEYSEKFGRHLVATRQIKPGEILFLEKPYCSKLMHDSIYTHCSYCLQPSLNLFPCECCVNEAYCSESCKCNAWDEYHEIECPVFGHLLAVESVDHLLVGMRMAIMATQKGAKLDSVREQLEDIDRNTDPYTKGFGDDGRFHSNQYRSVYTLLDDANECSGGMLFQSAILVAFTVCNLAIEGKIFGKKLDLDTLTTNSDVIFLGELMLKNFRICIINLHNLGVSQNQIAEYAYGIMPVFSLLNHSCDPNTFRQWYVDGMVVRAIHPIEQGEQIFDNYGLRYTLMVKSERHQALRQWNFDCECLPCSRDWPVYKELPSYKEQPIPRDNKIKLDKILQNLGKMSRDLMMKDDKAKIEMINELLKTIEELYNLAQRPCKELCTVVQIAEKFYLSGDAIFDYKMENPESDIIMGPRMFYAALDDLLS